jgi:hypothetical protein
MKVTIWRSSILILLVMMATAVAQQKASVKYDGTTEAILKGTVTEVKEVPRSCLGETGLHLMITTDTGPLEVQVAPVDFLTTMGVTFTKGEKLQILGSKVMLEGNPLVLAREVTQDNNNVVVVRDKGGAPVWTWMKKG